MENLFCGFVLKFFYRGVSLTQRWVVGEFVLLLCFGWSLVIMEGQNKLSGMVNLRFLVCWNLVFYSCVSFYFWWFDIS